MPLVTNNTPYLIVLPNPAKVHAVLENLHEMQRVFFACPPPQLFSRRLKEMSLLKELSKTWGKREEIPPGPGSRHDRWRWICVPISLIFQNAFYLSMRRTSAEVYTLDHIYKYRHTAINTTSVSTETASIRGPPPSPSFPQPDGRAPCAVQSVSDPH